MCRRHQTPGGDRRRRGCAGWRRRRPPHPGSPGQTAGRRRVPGGCILPPRRQPGPAPAGRRQASRQEVQCRCRYSAVQKPQGDSGLRPRIKPANALSQQASSVQTAAPDSFAARNVCAHPCPRASPYARLTCSTKPLLRPGLRPGLAASESLLAVPAGSQRNQMGGWG